MAESPPDNPHGPADDPNRKDPGESLDHYELADHPDEMDDGPPPAVPSKPPKPAPAKSAQSAGDESTPTPSTSLTGSQATTPAPAAPSHCPHCKKAITGNMLAGNCPHCGKRIADLADTDQQSAKHANVALALGILSIPLGLTCLGLLGTIFGSVLGAILGGVAVHFARQAKQEIAQGHAPPASEGAANLGHLCGIIGVVLGCALTLFYAAMQLIAFALEF